MKGVRLIKKPSLIRVKKRETPIQVYSCDTCEIFKNIYFGEHLWTTASKSEYVTQKTIHLFLSQNYDFHNYDYNLWGSEVSSVLCEVIVFADLFYKNFHSFFFLTLFFRTKRWNFSSRKQLTREKILEKFMFTQKLSREKFQLGRKMQLKPYLLYSLKSFLVRSFKPEKGYN